MTDVAITPKRQPPSVEFRHQLDAMTPQFALALPPHVPAERFVRIVMTAVQSNPDLLTKDRQSLFEASMKCAQDGLLPDGRDAALVIHGSKVTYMPMVAGILSKVRRSGELKSISAHVVYEMDEFDYMLGDEERIHHKPFLGEPRGKPIITYAVAHTKDGGVYREVMTEAQVMAVKAISRAKGGPWSGPFADEMRRKTALRRLSKRLPMSTDLLAVIERDDDLYDLKLARDVTGQGSGLAARLAAPQADTVTEGFTVHHPLTDDEIPSFDAAPPVSEQPVSDDAEQPPQVGASEAGDDFPGDRVADEDQPDPMLARADRTIADVAFKSLAELKTLKEEGRFKAFVAALRVQHPDKADEVEKSLADAIGSFG
jgi:recombination protein RecT